jgi:hypothetical protein
MVHSQCVLADDVVHAQWGRLSSEVFTISILPPQLYTFSSLSPLTTPALGKNFVVGQYVETTMILNEKEDKAGNKKSPREYMSTNDLKGEIGGEDEKKTFAQVELICNLSMYLCVIVVRRMYSMIEIGYLVK